jgi:hypothetical protein
VFKFQIWLLITSSESEGLVERAAQSIQHHVWPNVKFAHPTPVSLFHFSAPHFSAKNLAFEEIMAEKWGAEKWDQSLSININCHRVAVC